MRTEYRYGLGRDRRELSYYQTREWCRHIADFKKNFVGQKGAENSNAKLKDEDVLFVRSFEVMPRKLALELAEEFGVAIPYIYQLRKIVSGRYKKWPHLRFVKGPE